MTKTERRKLVVEIRQMASYLSYLADDDTLTEGQKSWRISEALNVIDGNSAQLREALTDGQ